MQELISTFGKTTDFYQTEYMTDITCDVHCTSYGFIKDGKLSGFFFSERYIELPYVSPELFYVAGIQDGGYEDWLILRIKNERSKIELQGNPRPDVLIERDNDDRIVFFGMQKDGKPHGLGLSIEHAPGVTKTPHFGLWQNGVKTHAFKDGELCPI